MIRRSSSGLQTKPKTSPKKYSAADFFRFFMSDADFRQRAVFDMIQNPAFYPSIEKGSEPNAWMAPVTHSARMNGFEFTDSDFIKQAELSGIEEFLSLLRATADSYKKPKTVTKKQYVWKWSGSFFGYIDGENLWAKNGKHVAKIINGEIYDFKGHYIGEIQNQNRLIVDKRKVRSNKRMSRSFSMLSSRAAISSEGNLPGNSFRPDFQDFMVD